MKKISLLLFSILIFLVIPAIVWGCPPVEKRCILGCNGEVQRRSCSLVCAAQDAEGRCIREECRCTSWETFQDCESWQRCDGTKACYCHGNCIAAPRDPRYFNNPNFPTDPHNPEPSRDPENILLPVKLDWADVRGWIGGWREKPAGCAEGVAPHYGRCVKSYEIRIYDTTHNDPNKEYFFKVLDRSEFNPLRFDPPYYCLLRSYTRHRWQVRGCCPVDGGYPDREEFCGPWSDWNFKTTPAAQLRTIFSDPEETISNYIRQHKRLPDQTRGLFRVPNPDPDWKYPEIKTEGNLMPPIVIDWCPIDKEMEVDGRETERRRLQRKIKEILRLQPGFQPRPPYYEEHTFPKGFAMRYRMVFYECEREQGDECEEWKPHFRYEDLEGEMVPDFTWVFFEEGEERKPTFPDFFLDQNRFFLTYDTKYKVVIERCGSIYETEEEEEHDGEGFYCFDRDYRSQAWHFKTEGDRNSLPGIPDILRPEEREPDMRTPEPLPFRLTYRISQGANYHELWVRTIRGLEWKTVIRGMERYVPAVIGGHIDYFRLHDPPVALESNFVLTFPGGIGDREITLNHSYMVKIRGCLTNEVDADGHGKNCRHEWTTARFYTPGGKPLFLRITSDRQNRKAIIPVNFSWHHFEGDNSFKIRLSGRDEPFITRTGSIVIGYPDLELNKDYTIQVWACVDADGKICGPKYAHLRFRTFTLKSPTNLVVAPLNIDNKVQTPDFVDFKWDPVLGSAFYQIEIRGPAPENRVITRIVDTNNVKIHQRYLVELGDYTWRVRACIGRSCRDIRPLSAGDWSQLASFHLLPPIEKPADAWHGLVVCGLLVDNPATGWNEREACTIRHIPLTIYVIIDFILWRVVPIILVLLIMLTAFFYYTAFANAEEINQITPKVKKMWKSFAIGFFVIFFGFTIINIFLGIIDFNVDVWGRWYEI